MYDFIKGKHRQGMTEVGVGRMLDLADGIVAKQFGTRSKTGAAVDAGADKLLVAGASITLTRAGVISKKFAATTLAQETRIFTENAGIERAGGEPNPSQLGKYRMAVLWLAIGGRAAEFTLRKTGHERAAKVAGATTLATEAASLGMGEKVIAGYRKQRRSLKK
jgi:phosphatidylglycerophosphate synthase